ncbi:hypothetical protein ACJX0J_033239, partial [Zea mays]
LTSRDGSVVHQHVFGTSPEILAGFICLFYIVFHHQLTLVTIKRYDNKCGKYSELGEGGYGAYMPNGSLDRYIYSEQPKEALGKLSSLSRRNRTWLEAGKTSIFHIGSMITSPKKYDEKMFARLFSCV